MGEALFGALRLVVARPAFWVTWALLSILTVGATIFAAFYIQKLGTPVDRAAAIANRNVTAIIVDQAWRQILLLPVFCVGYGVSIAAYLRAALEPEARAASTIRLGGDELRLSLCIFALLAGFDLIFAGANLIAIEVQPAQGGVSLLMLLIILPPYVAAAWIVSQLWVGPVDILARGTVDVRRIFSLGVGRRARLFWTFVLAGLLAWVLGGFGRFIAGEAWAASAHQPAPSLFASMLPSNSSEVASPYSGSTWLMVAVHSVLGGISFATFIWPTALVYQTLSTGPEDVF